jgi:hypothetical protein
LFNLDAQRFIAKAVSAELPFLFLKLPVEVILHVERLFAIHTGLFGPLLLEYQVITQQLVEQLRYIKQPTQ